MCSTLGGKAAHTIPHASCVFRLGCIVFSFFFFNSALCCLIYCLYPMCIFLHLSVVFFFLDLFIYLFLARVICEALGVAFGYEMCHINKFVIHPSVHPVWFLCQWVHRLPQLERIPPPPAQHHHHPPKYNKHNRQTDQSSCD